MANIITVISGNGGMGKSLFSCNIACGLCIMDKKVLLVEMNFGSAIDDVILGIKSETLFNIKDVCDNTCDIQDAITHPDISYLPDFICASPVVSDVDTDKALENIKHSLSSIYDFIIIDTSHISTDYTASAIKHSDTVIALTDGTFVSRRNTSLAVSYARTLGNKNIFCVLNNVVINNDNASIYIEDVIDEVGAHLLGIVPSDNCIDDSISNGTPIIKYNTFAGRAYENICKRLLGENIYKYETGVTNGFFGKNKLVIK